jgi:hypothetical protein
MKLQNYAELKYTYNIPELLKTVGFADKNNINIVPYVRLKKNVMFHFFRKFIPVLHNGFHIIMKNHSEFRLLFPMANETRELPYHSKQAWLYLCRLNFIQQPSRCEEEERQ